MLDLYTTRRSVTCALGRMPINGIGVRVPSGWVIYRPTPSLYKLIRVGDVAATVDGDDWLAVALDLWAEVAA